MLFVLILNFVVDHGVNFTSVEIEIELQVILRAHELEYCFSRSQTKSHQRVMYIRKVI